MRYIFPAVLLFKSATAAIILETIDGRFGVEFDSTDNVEGTIPGYASIRISASSNFIFSTNADPSDWREIEPMYQSTNAVTIGPNGGDQLRLPFNYNIRVINGETFAYLEPTLHISGSPDSVFARSVSGFVAEPLSANTGRIHINPQSVEDLVYDGLILYTPAVRDPEWSSVWGSSDFWGANTAIKLVDPTTPTTHNQEDEYRPCMLEDPRGQSDILVLPSSIYQNILDRITSRGFQIIRRNESQGVMRYVRGDLTDEIIASFPTLQYVLPSSDGTDFNIASISPNEYIVRTNDPRIYKLLLSRIMTSEICVLTKPILGKLVLHFDTLNNRLGFGEPLIEM